MSDRQKVLIALIASILLHGVIFFSFGISGMLHGDSNQKPLEKLKLVSVNVATPTPIPFQLMPMQARATPTPMIDSDDLHETDKAPKKPLFESDKNLAAGSMQPAKGNVPLPSQEGKDRKELAFSTHKYSLGKGEESAVPPVMEMAPAPDVPKSRTESTPRPQVRPTPQPTPTPEPTAQPTPKAEQTVAAVTPTPTPAVEEPFFRPTPVPAQVAVPTPDFARPTPVATPQPVEKVAMLTPPKPQTPPERVQPQQPQQPQQPASLPETQQSQIEGSISNRDRPGVEAIGTPLGRYRKRISDAIRGGWYSYVEQRRDLITSGSVRIRFSINQNGEVEDLKVLSNDSNNEALESCSVQAINSAKFLPPPPEIAPSLENGRYEETFTFTVYPYQ